MTKWNKLGEWNNINGMFKKAKRHLKKLPYVATIATVLNTSIPQTAVAKNDLNYEKERIEEIINNLNTEKEWVGDTININMVSTPQQQVNMVHNIQQRVWINLPNEYEQKVKEFSDYTKIFRNKDVMKFTEDFIVEEMKNDWWISKENQLLFEYYAIFIDTLNEDIYDWLDGNEKRLEEFEKAIDYIDNCTLKYKILLSIYVDSLSAKADREYNDSKNRVVELIHTRLKQIIDFYDLYMECPECVNQWQLQQTQEHSKRIIKDCKDYDIDYKAFLLEQVWTDEKVDEIIKFYKIK